MKQGVAGLRLISIFLCCLLVGCVPIGKKEVAQADRLMVINVLGPNEYDDAHITDSVNVPFNDLEKRARKWDKNIRLVVYCANYACLSSAEGAKKLKTLGFDAQAYEGGTAEWKAKGYPVTGPQKAGYLSMVGEPGTHEGVEIIEIGRLKDEMDSAKEKGLLITDVKNALAA